MEGYFLLVDLLGFENIVKNLDKEELAGRIDEWVALAKESVEQNNLSNLLLLSDTLFIGTGNTNKDLGNLIAASKHLLNKSILSSLPVRGAISFGHYEWGNLVYGQAVIDAHSLESQQNWVGIACQNNLPHIESYWGSGSLICYPVPKKSGFIQLAPVVDWDVPDMDNLMKLLSKGGLTKKDETLTHPWMDKIEKTISFSLYKKIVQKAGASYKEFHGFSSMQTIEMNMK